MHRFRTPILNRGDLPVPVVCELLADLKTRAERANARQMAKSGFRTGPIEPTNFGELDVKPKK